MLDPESSDDENFSETINDQDDENFLETINDQDHLSNESDDPCDLLEPADVFEASLSHKFM